MLYCWTQISTCTVFVRTGKTTWTTPQATQQTNTHFRLHVYDLWFFPALKSYYLSEINSNRDPRATWITWKKKFQSNKQAFTKYEYNITIMKRKKKINPFLLFKNTEFFFTCTNVTSLDQRIICDKFGWNWACSSGEKTFKRCWWIILFCFHFSLIKKKWIP